jgi:1-deoxy-D-xylulose-5-phosphate reductoisomerase
VKHIYLLGATGSIGKQTIEIIRENKDDFVLKGISGYNNLNLVKKLVSEFHLEVVCVRSKEESSEIEKLDRNIKCFYGEKGLVDLVSYNQDKEIIIINALVGMVGLKPTIKALELNRNVLLANKETLVVGGHLIKEVLSHSKAKLYPIDSEHSALWQMLDGVDLNTVKRLVITASGGSFRDKTREELSDVSLKDALNHPNWEMGNKITIDSATMMNKGFEIIEAAYLFDIDISQIEAIMHRESLVHSLVEFVDGSIIAQISDHDMKLPIHYAMYYPLRKKSIAKKLDLVRLNNIHFEEIDYKRYPCLNYAKEAYLKGGSMRTVLNSANEIAVSLFIENKISFLDIEKIIYQEMQKHQVIDFPSVEEIYQIDQEIKQRIYRQY